MTNARITAHYRNHRNEPCTALAWTNAHGAPTSGEVIWSDRGAVVTGGNVFAQEALETLSLRQRLGAWEAALASDGGAQ